MKNLKRSLLKPTLQEEKKLWKKGFNYVIGVDEVGRGAFAGPVAVASVVFSKDLPYKLAKEINDSKLLSKKKRTMLSPLIKKHSLVYSISIESVKTINKQGIGYATKKAFRKNIAKTKKKLLKNNGSHIKPFLLIDGFHIRYIRSFRLKNQKAIVKGDRISLSIAAASIIAKVYRDSLMDRLGEKHPEYKWENNKGYGTKKHRESIRRFGMSAQHRTSFNIFP